MRSNGRARRGVVGVALAVTVVLSAAIVACAPTTKVTSTWREPGATSAEIKRPLVAFLHADEAMRRSVEDAMAERIPNAVAAYRVLSQEEIREGEKAREKVRAAGFDGVITMRLVGIDKEIDYVPGTWCCPTYYGSLWGPGYGYWGYGWGTVYQPGYLTTTTVVTLESLVYSLSDEKGELLWASRSETFDPSSTERLVASVIKAQTKRCATRGSSRRAERGCTRRRQFRLSATRPQGTAPRSLATEACRIAGPDGPASCFAGDAHGPRAARVRRMEL
jgi:hypothetical protein